jgi:hypothetical protein
VIGFFQGSFVKALEAWIHNDPDVAMIADMKSKRSIFDREEIQDIRRYTTAELRCLVSLMEAVRDSLKAQDLTITRWDGAGAIAGALFKKHGVKEHMADTPLEVFQAARVAYSGGHIEACKLGYRNKEVHHYDVNSAYPDQFRRLPSLSQGQWTSGSGTPPAGFTLVHVQFCYKRGLPFYPLFHRSPRGSILYPREGSGWYWFDEYQAAADFARIHGALTFDVIAWHHLHPQFNESPFTWIEPAYERRQQIIAESKRTGVINGEERIIKLGLNSCYGKTCQQVGARLDGDDILPPPYFQIEWGGAVTAGCRAKLMHAATQNPDAIISFATDALFSTEPLDLYCPPIKELGAWEYQRHKGMTIVMPGVYWLHDEPSAENPMGLTQYTRGMRKEHMDDIATVRHAWRTRQDYLMMKHESMVTLGAASMSENFWKLRGLFVTTTRELKLNGANSKRYPVTLSACKPHLDMVSTWPAEARDSDELSDIYPLEWLDANGDTIALNSDGAAEALNSDGAAEAHLIDSMEAAEASFFL